MTDAGDKLPASFHLQSAWLELPASYRFSASNFPKVEQLRKIETEEHIKAKIPNTQRHPLGWEVYSLEGRRLEPQRLVVVQEKVKGKTWWEEATKETKPTWWRLWGTKAILAMTNFIVHLPCQALFSSSLILQISQVTKKRRKTDDGWTVCQQEDVGSSPTFRCKSNFPIFQRPMRTTCWKLINGQSMQKRETFYLSQIWGL